MALARLFVLSVFFVLCSAKGALAEPAAGTPVADSSHAAATAGSPLLILRVGGIVTSSAGAMAEADARVVRDLYFGLEGGAFTEHSYGQWFVGARASYRFPLTRALHLVPSLGVAHVGLAPRDERPNVVVTEAPISPNAALALDVTFGTFVVGARATLMPVVLTETTRVIGPIETTTEQTRAFLDVPIGIYAGITL